MRNIIKLVVFLEQPLSAGGGHQQALNAVLLANKLPQSSCTLFFVTTVSSNVAILQDHGIKAYYLPITKWYRVCLKLRRLIKGQYIDHVIGSILGNNAIERFLSRNEVDLVYFTSPSSLIQHLDRTNYIVTVWDLCHRDEPEFPEVRYDREFENREILYNSMLTKAVAVLVDSEIGQENVIRRYGVDEARVHVMPFTPATGTQITAAEYKVNFIDVKSKYDLDTDYIFYPAQFWAHKNHTYILYALKILEDNYGIRLGAIFSGGDIGGNLSYIKNISHELGLIERIRFAGFVPNEEIPYLYRQSVALVMPTYFGPTNIPPLEAFSLGVPVLYSDKHGLREQVKNAALLIDLHNPENLANHLEKLVLSESLRNTLIENGKQYMETLESEDHLSILISIIKDFSFRRMCWK